MDPAWQHEAGAEKGHEAAQINQQEESEEVLYHVAGNNNLDELHLDQEDVHADAKITDDGRFNIRLGGRRETLYRLFQPIFDDEKPPAYEQAAEPEAAPASPPPPFALPTKLNIVMQIVGSRGDVQPFIALGQELRRHGHRVRLASHPTFRSFVEEAGSQSQSDSSGEREGSLEFFSIGGDPAELMAFMVKNPGLLPGVESFRAGDVGKRRRDMAGIIDGCWRSCVEADDGERVDEPRGAEARPFVADAIIANPPSFAHIHCAEKLRIPLHIMFTMPWSPTKAFPHPLANIQTAEYVNEKIMNYFSYAVVETMTWQGLGDLINSFRVKRLGLGEIDPTFAPGMISRLKVPHTYAWSPALIPKPDDWASHLSVSGFFFLPLASTYQPPADLETFLRTGPPPIYIGFGSIVVGDPDALTALILEAVRRSGVRALVSKGWGGLGSSDMSLPKDVFMLGNCPHDWLFPRVSCVVHHGGAGTMAAGIAAGKPTIIVPFFGDQPFWGDMVARAGAGPTPIPHRKLTADRLASAIVQALQPAMTDRAVELGALINRERGVQTATSSFYSHLPLQSMHCSVSPSRLAVWRVSKTDIRLSAMAAAVLTREGVVDLDSLKLYGPCDHRTDAGASDPLSATVKVSYRMVSDLLTGFSDVSRGMYKSLGPKPITATSTTNPIPDSASTSAAAAAKSSNASTASSSIADHSDLDSGSEAGEVITRSTHSLPPPGDDPLGHSLPENISNRTTTTNNTLVTTSGGSTTGATKRSRTKKGFKKLGALPFKMTAEFTNSLAEGMHNAPRLYGDKTVRTPDKITGWQSGLVAAGKELGLGVYDGFTGIVTQPIRGYKEEGSVGLYKGIGKGIGGVMIKPVAGASGLVGFTFSGIYKEVQKKYGKTVDGYIRAARLAQGFEECKTATAEECADIIAQWHELQSDGKKKKGWRAPETDF